jgi:hypothetical protein
MPRGLYSSITGIKGMAKGATATTAGTTARFTKSRLLCGTSGHCRLQMHHKSDGYNKGVGLLSPLYRGTDIEVCGGEDLRAPHMVYLRRQDADREQMSERQSPPRHLVNSFGLFNLDPDFFTNRDGD